MTKFCEKCAAETERDSKGRCKPCAKQYGIAYRAANREKVKQRCDAWKKANPERRREYGAAWKAANPEAVKAHAATHYAANREDRRRRNAAYHAANPEQSRLRAAAYYAAHKQECAKSRAEWAAANQDSIRVYRMNRKARVRAAGGRLSPNLTEKLLKLQRGKCACCALPLGSRFHLDHIVPISLGGKNVDTNIQLLRATCNLKKHAKHPVDFMQSLGYLL